MKWSDYQIKTTVIDNKFYPIKKVYYRGNFSKKIFKNTISVVGSRKMTRYGAQIVEEFVTSFVQSGLTVISGFMYGVDTAAHSTCVELGGKTIAVFANGLNQYYPPENEKLYTKILDNNGLVISEYEPETKPKLWSFAQRNKIVAALATKGVLVVEAGEKSGSLITARWAKKYKKQLFAAPGPISSSVSKGTNELIKNGDAIMVTKPEDILGQKASGVLKENKLDLNPDEKKVYEALERESLSIDEMAVVLNKNIIEISALITNISLKGLVTEAAGKYYLSSRSDPS